jgi:ureidoacrylate peracid hydrolase
VPVIYTRYVLRPDYRDSGLLREVFPKFEAVGHVIIGTWDAEIVDELKPKSGDYVIDKSRYSAFYNTNLEILLRGLGADTLLLTGVTTNMCVESTLRDAFFRDYRVVLIEDCTAAVDSPMKEATIRTVRYGFGSVASSRDVVEVLSSEAKLETAKSIR